MTMQLLESYEFIHTFFSLFFY